MDHYSREDFRGLEDAVTVTPPGGAPYGANAVFLPKDDEDTVVEGPLLAFWNADPPGPPKQGATVVIPLGPPYAGTWKVTSHRRNDGEVTKVAITRG
jgi:hypothetical protein